MCNIRTIVAPVINGALQKIANSTHNNYVQLSGNYKLLKLQKSFSLVLLNSKKYIINLKILHFLDRIPKLKYYKFNKMLILWLRTLFPEIYQH